MLEKSKAKNLEIMECLVKLPKKETRFKNGFTNSWINKLLKTM